MKIGNIVYIPDCSRVIEMKIVNVIASTVYVLEGEYAFDVRNPGLRYKLSEKKNATYPFYIVNAYSDFETTFHSTKEYYEKRIKKYKDEIRIRNIKDLLQYPIRHDLSSIDEDEPMYVAYIERAKELLGIDISIS